MFAPSKRTTGDENHAALKQNYEILKQSTDQNGQPLQVIKLPMPPAIDDTVRGEKQTARCELYQFSHRESVVLVPAFNHPNDEKARAFFGIFPGRAVVGIDCTDIIYGAGTLHCISQQQPST